MSLNESIVEVEATLWRDSALEWFQAIFAEGELRTEATIRCYRIVRTEGKREVALGIEHYNLSALNLALRGIEVDFGPEHFDTYRCDKCSYERITIEKYKPIDGQIRLVDRNKFIGFRYRLLTDTPCC
jgi:hypothetical protein